MCVCVCDTESYRVDDRALVSNNSRNILCNGRYAVSPANYISIIKEIYINGM